MIETVKNESKNYRFWAAYRRNYRRFSATSRSRYDILHPVTKKPVNMHPNGWSFAPEKMEVLLAEDRIKFGADEQTRPTLKVYIEEANEEAVYSVFYQDGRASSKRLNSLMDGEVFDFPKDEHIIQSLIEMTTVENDLVLDFFSGSATTAHAIMQLNAEEGANRKYIQVQLPEAIEEKSKAYQADYKTICEIGKERIRRAAKKIKAEKLEKAKKDGLFADFTDEQDYGFRVYRLDSSNMQDVYYRPRDYQQSQLDAFADNIKPDRTPDDLLTQILLDWGLPLSLKIITAEISGKKVYQVAENSLYACFDKGIDEEFAKEIAKDSPLRVVFRDNGFKNDTAKVNVRQLLKQLSPETEMKVI